jgi:hypothetical protein
VGSYYVHLCRVFMTFGTRFFAMVTVNCVKVIHSKSRSQCLSSGGKKLGFESMHVTEKFCGFLGVVFPRGPHIYIVHVFSYTFLHDARLGETGRGKATKTTS